MAYFLFVFPQERKRKIVGWMGLLGFKFGVAHLLAIRVKQCKSFLQLNTRVNKFALSIATLLHKLKLNLNTISRHSLLYTHVQV